jgi:hypothetical protein
VPDGVRGIGLTGARVVALQLNRNPRPLLEKSEWKVTYNWLPLVCVTAGSVSPQNRPSSGESAAPPSYSCKNNKNINK